MLSLSVAYDKVGNVQVAQGDLPGRRMKSYRDGLAIRDRLAKADPGNAGGSAICRCPIAKIGDVLRRMGASAEALSALRQGQAMMVRMTRLSPDNTTWKNDLAWFNEQIAQLKPSR